MKKMLLPFLLLAGISIPCISQVFTIDIPMSIAEGDNFTATFSITAAPAGNHTYEVNASCNSNGGPGFCGTGICTFTTSDAGGNIGFCTMNFIAPSGAGSNTVNIAADILPDGGNGCICSATSATVVLPVELVDFNVKAHSKSVNLDWTTASELNNEMFIVERSNDGNNFKSIGEVVGTGTLFEFTRYQFIDEHPSAGINYYRLEQRDFDGNFEYSTIQSAVIPNEGEILVYPTVAQSEFQVVLPRNASEETEVSIYSLQGSLVQKQTQEGSGTFRVTLPQLTAGQYIVEVINGNVSKRSLIFKQ